MKYLIHADDFGRSKSINRSIYKLIIKKKINSVSLIICQSGYKDALGLIKKIKKKINIRLHLNLTDGVSIKNLKIYNNTFFKLLIMPYIPFYRKNMKIIEEEIIEQIKIFKKDLKLKYLSIDSHQHIHIIPWIFNIILKNKDKYNLKYVRIPNENFYYSKLYDFLNIYYLINILKYFVIKILLKFLNTKILYFAYKYKFSGILFSGINTIKSVDISIKLANKKNIKNLEILFHPGRCTKNEKKIFKTSFFNYYYSIKRKKEQYVLNKLTLVKR